MREPFLTPELFKSLSASNDSTTDYFTKTETYPRAFRVAACKSDSADKTDFQIQLLWRDEKASSQQNVQAEAVLIGDKWLISKVTN